MLMFRRPDIIPNSHTLLQPMVVLTCEGFPITPAGDDDPYPSFHTETYDRLAKDRHRVAGDAILKHINDFLAEFSLSDQSQIFAYYVAAKHILSRVGLDCTVQRATDLLTERTTYLMHTLGFADRALALLRTTMPMPNLDYVGAAAHYTSEYSFYEADYYDLTAISLLCKCLSPVWGEFIFRIKQSYVDTVRNKEVLLIDERDNKELFCVTLILPTLEQSVLAPTYHKLHKYLRNQIKHVIRTVVNTSSRTQPAIDFVMAKYGYDERRFEDYVYAILLVKRIVGFDPWQIGADGKIANIGTNLNVVINKTASAQLKHMRDGTLTLTRSDIEENGPEQDSISYAENMARISATTADVPIAVVFGVQMQIPRLLKLYGLSKLHYTEALAYYRHKITEPSVLNMAILAVLHASWMGGSRLLQYLDFSTYVALLTCSQMHLLKLGEYQLAAHLTCRTSPMVVMAIRPEGQRIANNIKTTKEYRQMLDRYPGLAEHTLPGSMSSTGRGKRELVEHINIASQLEKIQTWLLNHDHLTEFAPVLLDALPPEWQARVVPDEPLLYDEQIIRELCAFFLSQSGSVSSEMGDRRR